MCNFHDLIWDRVGDHPHPKSFKLSNTVNKKGQNEVKLTTQSTGHIRAWPNIWLNQPVLTQPEQVTCLAFPSPTGQGSQPIETPSLGSAPGPTGGGWEHWHPAPTATFLRSSRNGGYLPKRPASLTKHRQCIIQQGARNDSCVGRVMQVLKHFPNFHHPTENLCFGISSPSRFQRPQRRVRRENSSFMRSPLGIPAHY